jgi:hypothetical protein
MWMIVQIVRPGMLSQRDSGSGTRQLAFPITMNADTGVLNSLLRDRESPDRTGLSGREFALERLTREHFVSEVLSIYNSIAMR